MAYNKTIKISRKHMGSTHQGSCLKTYSARSL